MKPGRRKVGWTEMARWVVGVHMIFVRNHLRLKLWLRRLRWLGLWLVGQQSMRVWLAAPDSTGEILPHAHARR